MSCSTCRHWKQPAERDGYSSALTYSGVTTLGEDWDPELSDRAYRRTEDADLLYGECKAIVMSYDLPLDVEPPLATVRDGSDYVATLFTRAEFTCAMHADLSTTEGD